MYTIALDHDSLIEVIELLSWNISLSAAKQVPSLNYISFRAYLTLLAMLCACNLNTFLSYWSKLLSCHWLLH